MRIRDSSSDVCSSDLELGLLGQLLERDHVKLPVIHARVAGETIPVADFRHLPVAAPYIALMPQWHFLDFVAEAAAHYPGFTLRREAEAVATIEQAGRTTGVRLASGDAVQARLVVAADGRQSVDRTRTRTNTSHY